MLIKADDSISSNGSCLKCDRAFQENELVISVCSSSISWLHFHLACYRFPFALKTVAEIEGFDDLKEEHQLQIIQCFEEALAKRETSSPPNAKKTKSEDKSSQKKRKNPQENEYQEENDEDEDEDFEIPTSRLKRKRSNQKGKAKEENGSISGEKKPLTEEDLLHKNTLKTLKKMLSFNEQPTTGTKDELIEKILELSEKGAYPKCPKCNKSTLKSVFSEDEKETYVCPGFFEGSKYTRCGFTAPRETLPRLPWKQLEGKDWTSVEFERNRE